MGSGILQRDSTYDERRGENSRLKARGGLFREFLTFEDPAILLTSPSNFWMGIGEIEREQWIGKYHKLVTGIHYSWTQAHTTAYQEPPTQNSLALFATDQITLKKWDIQLAARQEMVNGVLIPPVGHISAYYKARDYLHFHIRGGRNYRVPAFGSPEEIQRSYQRVDGIKNWECDGLC